MYSIRICNVKYRAVHNALKNYKRIPLPPDHYDRESCFSVANENTNLFIT